MSANKPTVAPQRNPALYRAKKRDEAALLAEQIRKCYEEHKPPQIVYANPMKRCLALVPVSPRCARKG